MSNSVRRSLMLIEMHNLRVTLLEDRMDYLRNMFLPKFEEAMPSILLHQSDMLRTLGVLGAAPTTGAEVVAMMKDKDARYKAMAEQLLNVIVAADPNKAKKNAKWLCVLVTRGMPLEDLEKATDYLTQYEERKKARQLPPEFNNIERFKSLGDLFTALHGVQQSQEMAVNDEYNEALRQSQVALDTDKYMIVLPKTQQAANYWGRDTEWCTAWGCPKGRYPTRTSQYPNYASRGQLYVIFDKTNGRKWQFHFESRQLMDEHDRQIDINAFIRTHPEVAAFFEKEDEAKTVVGEVGGYRVLLSAADVGHVLEFKRAGAGMLKRLGAGAREPVIGLDAQRQIIGVDRIEALNTTDKHDGFPFTVTSSAGLALKKLFETLKVKGAPTGKQYFGLFALFFHNGRWGDLDEVGDPVLKSQGGEWVGIVPEDGPWYLAFVQGGSVHLDGLVHPSGVLSIPAADLRSASTDRYGRTTYGAPNPVLSEAVVDLVLHFGDAISSFGGAHYRSATLTADALDPKAGIRLIEADEDFTTVPLLYAAYGAADPRFQDAFIEKLDERGVDHGALLNGGQDIVMQEFGDIEELVDECGDETAKSIIDTESNHEYFEDHEATADDSDKEDLLQSLTPEEIKGVGDYLLDAYPESAADMEDYDPTDIDKILELQNEVDDDDLNNCFNFAVQDGRRVGAETEAFDALKSAISQAPIWYKNKAGVYEDIKGDKFEWDTPCAIVAPVSDLVDEIRDEDLESLAYENNWLKYKGEEIKVDSGRYGWSGYDADAAKEYFGELLYDHGVLNRKSHSAQPDESNDGENT